jgi:hypothetical protein
LAGEAGSLAAYWAEAKGSLYQTDQRFPMLPEKCELPSVVVSQPQVSVHELL